MNGCNQSPLRLPKMLHQNWPSLSWHSLSRWGRERVSPSFDSQGAQSFKRRHRHTKVNIVRLTVEILNGTITGETQNPVPEIGTNRSRQSWQDLRVGGHQYGFGATRGSRAGFWTDLGPNKTIYAVHPWLTCRVPWLVSIISTIQATAVRTWATRIGCLSSSFHSSVSVNRPVSKLQKLLVPSLSILQFTMMIACALCYIIMPGALCTTITTITLSISPTGVSTGCLSSNYLSATDSIRTSVASTVFDSGMC